MDTGQALLSGLVAGALIKLTEDQPIVADVQLLTDEKGYKPEIRVGVRIGEGLEYYLVTVQPDISVEIPEARVCASCHDREAELGSLVCSICRAA